MPSIPERAAFSGAQPLLAALALSALLACAGCARANDGLTVMWTNRPEFASYAELFNSSQNRYRLVVEFKDNPAGDFIAAKDSPDLVVGPWLKGEKARSKLAPVDYLFTELRLGSKLFYSSLLDLGNVRGRQYLLPVSFNLPALVFSPDRGSLIDNDFALSLEQIQRLSSDFNAKEKGVYTRMGFSPRWNSEFLYLVARMHNARFEEGSPLFAWNEEGLRSAIEYLRGWTRTINTSATAEDEFQFKYLYDPPYRLVTGGRSVFSYMPSDAIFVLPGDKRQNLDFRWVMKDGKTPIRDDIVYMGVSRKSKNLEAAEAFIVWFFTEKTQRALLDRSVAMGINSHSFGISGGFSSLRPVNERVFPLYYPSLLGHLPPPETLSVPRILPNNWELLKSDILVPWLEEMARKPEGMTPSLQEAIAAWQNAH